MTPHLITTRKAVLVGRDDWNVATEPTLLFTKRARLLAEKIDTRTGHKRHAEAHGWYFDSPEAAWAYAVEHGYAEPAVVPWCPWCRTRHWSDGRRVDYCPVKERFF